MDTCVKLTIRGRVQGVGFRWFTQREADRLGVKGYVRNQPNGDVEIEVEGDERVIHEFVERVQKGPPFSRVTEVICERKEYLGKYSSFDVTF